MFIFGWVLFSLGLLFLICMVWFSIFQWKRKKETLKLNNSTREKIIIHSLFMVAIIIMAIGIIINYGGIVLIHGS